MMRRIIFILAIATSMPASAQPAKNDYSDPKTWLCRPGRQDACAVDLTATIVAADGTLKREEFKANANPSINCCRTSKSPCTAIRAIRAQTTSSAM